MASILIGCERSGIVRDAFRALGHDAISCDLVASERPGPHIIGDVLEAAYSREWNLLIVFPGCTYLCSSGLHWNNRGRGWERTEAALEFVRALMAVPVPRFALENPRGCISTRIRKPDQSVQPYQFGEDASKETFLWLQNLPPLVASSYVEPRLVFHGGKWRKRWANQTDSGQNRLGPSPTRAMDRARTYQGIADAMAAQWSDLL